MRIRQADLLRQWQELESTMRGITESYIEPINRWAHERREPHVVQPAGP
jgi:hypothetical protein